MAMLGSVSSFTKKTYPTTEYCSECDAKRPAGFEWLVSIRKGRVQKRVCSEECRQKFDDDYWQGKARERKV